MLILQGLNFRAEWRESRPKFRNPVEKNREGGKLPPWKISVFQKNFALWNEIPYFREICRFSCNARQFLSVQGNFLLPIGGDSFPILHRLNAVRSKNSELSRGISRFLSVFGEIIVHLDKMFVKLKNWGNFYVPGISRKNRKFCRC